MDSKTMLGYMSGSVDEELLLRNESYGAKTQPVIFRSGK